MSKIFSSKVKIAGEQTNNFHEENVNKSSDFVFKEVYSMIRAKKISYLSIPAIAIYF